MGKSPAKVVLLRRRGLAAAAAAAACIAIFCALWLPSAVTASAARRQLPIYSVERPGKLCAISFDAAWGSEDTQALIDILGRYNIKTTFFAVGEWVKANPEAVQALHEAGHEVMNHSLHHDHYNQMSADEITADVTACNEAIAAVTGRTPTLLRCPYGEYDDHVIAAVRALGMEPIQWNVDSLDWKKLPAGEITERVTSALEPGSIVLFHNAAPHTPEALPEILEYMIRQGYTVVPVSELIYTENYSIDHTGRQAPAGESGDHS